MCTLILGRDVLEPRTLWIAANRDEDPGRPSAPPTSLLEHPRVSGGRDRVAGGTWLAIRERRAVVAMLNRRLGRGPGGPATDGAATPLRSRGLLALETAAAMEPRPGPGFGDAAVDHALRSLANASYAPFSMVIATVDGARLLAHAPPGPPRVAKIGRGWHVITHADLDDPAEPRTADLLADLRAWQPAGDEAIESGLIERLRRHEPPAVCIHEGRMVTVSASLVRLGPDAARYLHAEGRPCESPFEDRTVLLGRTASRETA